MSAYCMCGAEAPYDHNLGCAHAVYPTVFPVGCPTCAALKERVPMNEFNVDQTRPVTIQVQLYVEPGVLVPGQTVYWLTDHDQREPLEVLRIEPHLIVRLPDGTEKNVPAHAVELPR